MKYGYFIKRGISAGDVPIRTQTDLLLERLMRMEPVPKRVHLFLRLAAPVYHRNMRAEHLVPGQDVEVYAELLYVDGPVRCICNAVHAEHGFGDSVNDLGDGFYIVNRPQDIAGVRASH